MITVKPSHNTYRQEVNNYLANSILNKKKEKEKDLSQLPQDTKEPKFSKLAFINDAIWRKCTSLIKTDVIHQKRYKQVNNYCGELKQRILLHTARRKAQVAQTREIHNEPKKNQ